MESSLEPISELGKSIIRALSSSKYPYRSLEGLSADLNVTPERVNHGLSELFAKNQVDQLVRDDRIRYFLTSQGRATAYNLNQQSASALRGLFKDMAGGPESSFLFTPSFLENFRKYLEESKSKTNTPSGTDPSEKK